MGIGKVISHGRAGADHTNLSMAFFHHIRQHLIGKHIRSRKINPNQTVPLLIGHLIKGFASAKSRGIVHQNIHISKCPDRFLNGISNFIQLCHITAVRNCMSAPLLNLLCHLLGAVFFNIADHNIGSQVRQHNCRSPADPISGASHNRGLAFQAKIIKHCLLNPLCHPNSSFSCSLIFPVKMKRCSHLPLTQLLSPALQFSPAPERRRDGQLQGLFWRSARLKAQKFHLH